MKNWIRILAAVLGLALLASACGDDDAADVGANDPIEDDGAETPTDGAVGDDADPDPEAPAGDDPEQGFAPDADAYAAENGIPVPDWLEIGGLVELDNAELALAAEYNVPPPPGYDKALTDAGYEILDTQFGSIYYVAFSPDWGCLFALIEYENQAASGGWYKAIRVAAENKADCPTLADKYKTALSNVPHPFSFFVG